MKKITVKKAASKVSGYKIDFTTNTLIVNYKFYAASQQYGTPENKLVKNIQEDFPNLTIAVEKGRNPKKAHSRKRLSYKNMKLYIETLDNSEKLLDVFETVKAESKVQPSPYKYVVDWFQAQFKDYNKAPIFEDDKLTTQKAKEKKDNVYSIKREKSAS